MIFPQLSRFPYFALDTETTGIQWWKEKVFGFSISTPDGKDYYYDIRDEPEAVEALKNELRGFSTGTIIFHNAKFDHHHFRQSCGLLIPTHLTEDTCTRAALIDEHRHSYSLDDIAFDILGEHKENSIYQALADIFGGRPTRNAQMKNLHRAPSSLVAPYAKKDTRLTLKLWEEQQPEISEIKKVHQLEKDLFPVLLDMERHGVRVDIDRAVKARTDLEQIIKRDKAELKKIAGFEVNPNPSNSIHKLFKPKYNPENKTWTLIDGTITTSTKKGDKASIGSDTLREMKHPAAGLILKIRKLRKAVDTFINKHILEHHNNGLVHTTFNQTKTDGDVGTGTGRLSSNDPALQQIPKRDKEIASITRSLFIPDEDQTWSCVDWSQMDFRIFAHYLDNPHITGMYRKNPLVDFHQLTGDITGLPRSARFAGDANAKQINLGLIFGMGEGKMAKEMGLPFEIDSFSNGKEYLKAGDEAQEIFKKYHSAIPGVKNLLKSASSVANSRGYVMSAMGRRIRFPNRNLCYKAGGLIFQGTAADALKIKLIQVHDLLKGTEGRMLLSVHDEFDSSLPLGSGLNKKIKETIEDFGPDQPINLKIPIRSDSGEGPNWWEACK